VFGVTLPRRGPPSQIDIITGCGAVLVKPSFFNVTKLTDFDAAPRAAFFVDDIWLSGNLASTDTDRLVVPVKSQHATILFGIGWKARAGLIHSDNKGGRTNDAVLEYFKHLWRYEVPGGDPNQAHRFVLPPVPVPTKA
jgi:hypothetical protein